MRQDEARAMALLAAVVALWGVAWPMLKVGVSHLPPAWFGGWRMVIGSVALFALVLLTRQARRPARADLAVVFSVGLLQMAAPTALMLFALPLVDAGRASLLAFTHPLWVAPLAVLALGERLDARAALGLASGMSGLAVLFNPLAFDWSDRGTLLGNGLLLLSAMSWAAGIVHVRGHAWAAPPLALAPWQALVAAAALLPLAFWWEGRPTLPAAPIAWAILAYVGLVATAFCCWGAVEAQRRLPAMTASIGFLGTPVLGIAASAAALGEPVTAPLLIGLALILGGIATLVVRPPPEDAGIAGSR
jgi:drug/metabolite transporter (DMT)-like permease